MTNSWPVLNFPFLRPLLDDFSKQAVSFGYRLGASLLIFLVFCAVSFLVQKLICRFGRSSDPAREDILKLAGQISKSGLIIFGTVTALGTLGVNVSALVAGLGLTGFALGFAFRDALSNLLAGFLILIYRPFRRGDQISVAGFEGIVIGIDLRYTTLKGAGRYFLIPNSTLFTNAISLVEAPVPDPLLAEKKNSTPTNSNSDDKTIPTAEPHIEVKR